MALQDFPVIKKLLTLDNQNRGLFYFSSIKIYRNGCKAKKTEQTEKGPL